MAKVRVHELSKKLGMANKDIIAVLQANGIDVKTHSSSVYEEEALKVLKTEGVGTHSSGSEETPDKAVEAASSKKSARRSGMRIVRKRKKTVEEEPEVTTTPVDVVSADAQPSPLSEIAEPAVAAEITITAQEERAVGEDKSSDISEAAAKLVEVDASEVAASSSTIESTTKVEEAAKVDTKSDPAKEKEEAKVGGPRVLRMIDRSKLLERVPSNRLGGGADGRSGRGGHGFGGVREVRVVNDPFGGGREIVSVDKDKRAGPGGRPGARRPGGLGGRGRPNRMRQRNSFPSRLRRRRGVRRSRAPQLPTRAKESKRIVRMEETIQVTDLSHQLQMKAGEIIRILMGMGTMAGINDSVDMDTATLVAAEYGFTVVDIGFNEDEFITDYDDEEAIDTSDWEDRPPVVTIMGHVDHGKTSLLDKIRSSRVASGEAGGITQHIGAYSVITKNQGKITFIDTPGHAAFSAMRARGADVTDLIVLVVAADDGVMPQTREAIEHAKEAGCPVIVAVNKIDKPEANADKVMQELSQFGLQPEDWGGDTLFVNTSATAGTGIDELLEAITLQAEVLEIKADPEGQATGTVLEAKLEKGKGAVATILVEHGKLKRGDHIVVGECFGKVRAMSDAQGKRVKEAVPSDAVEVFGLDGVPNAGDQFDWVENADAAKKIIEYRRKKKLDEKNKIASRPSTASLMAQLAGGGDAKELRIILKAGVQGTVEAVKSSLEEMNNPAVSVKILMSGVGPVKESEVMMAVTSNATIYCFNVKADSKSRQMAVSEKVEIAEFKIIYKLLDAVKIGMEDLLDPELKENILGRAEVRQVFHIAKLGPVSGSRVVSGQASRSAQVRVLRAGQAIHSGKVTSLRHYKADVKTVESGLECGIGVEGYMDSIEGDVLEFFEIQEIRRTLDSVTADVAKAKAKAEASA